MHSGLPFDQRTSEEHEEMSKIFYRSDWSGFNPVSTRKISKERQGPKLDRSSDGKPAPKKRKASENDRNPRGEKRNAPAKATGAKSLPKRKR